MLSTALGVPITEQGAMVGRLNVYTEVVLMLIFTPLGVLSDRIGRRAVYAFGFSCLALSYALFPYATSETELALIRVIYSVGLGQGGCSQQWHGHRCSAGSGPDTLHHPQSAGLGFAIIAIFLLDRFHRVTGLAICMGLAASGYLLLGVGSAGLLGGSAVLTYLGGYIFTVLTAFAVITVVAARTDSDDISSFAALGQRSPLLATGLTVAMAGLAGIPPMAGFFGKFLLLKAVASHVATDKLFLVALLVACGGVVISLYYYFGVVRAMFWPRNATDLTSIEVGSATKLALAVCVIGVVYLGVFPDALLQGAKQAVAGLSVPASPAAPAPTAPHAVHAAAK